VNVSLLQTIQNALGVDYFRQAQAGATWLQANSKQIDREIELRGNDSLYPYQDASSLQRLQHQGKLTNTKPVVVPATIPVLGNGDSSNIMVKILVIIAGILGLSLILK